MDYFHYKAVCVLIFICNVSWRFVLIPGYAFRPEHIHICIISQYYPLTFMYVYDISAAEPCIFCQLCFLSPVSFICIEFPDHPLAAQLRNAFIMICMQMCHECAVQLPDAVLQQIRLQSFLSHIIIYAAASVYHIIAT